MHERPPTRPRANRKVHVRQRLPISGLTWSLAGSLVSRSAAMRRVEGGVYGRSAWVRAVRLEGGRHHRMTRCGPSNLNGAMINRKPMLFRLRATQRRENSSCIY